MPIHKAGGWSSVVAIKTPTGGRSNYVAPQHPPHEVLPVCVQLCKKIYNVRVRII